MGLQVSKNIIFPRVDTIRESETRKFMQDLLKVLQQMNTTYHNDLSHLEERIKALEP
jgi:hypothetical protein